MNTVDEERLRSRHTHLVQSMNCRHAILLQGVFSISKIFCHMDMTSHSCILCNARTFLQCFIREREGCMQPHHGGDLSVTFANLFDEALVFPNAASHLISVRDFITQRGADPCLANSVFDQVK